MTLGTSNCAGVWGRSVVTLSVTLGCAAQQSHLANHPTASATRGYPAMQLRGRIDVRMPGLLDSAGIPGFGLAMIVRGRIVLERTFGVAIDSATVFEGASLSKPLLAYVALRLRDRGQLDLDRPLSDYLPLDELHDDRKSQITARMVLAHTTGLQNVRSRSIPRTATPRRRSDKSRVGKDEGILTLGD
jgi:CubicO group peptidase (beta-lactamase class C family)